MPLPTPGRIVHYFPSEHAPLPQIEGAPLAAIVAGVDRLGRLNLSVCDAAGRQYARQGIAFVDSNEPRPEGGNFCTWPSEFVAPITTTTPPPEPVAPQEEAATPAEELAAPEPAPAPAAPEPVVEATPEPVAETAAEVVSEAVDEAPPAPPAA